MADLRSVCLCVILSANKFTWAEYDFSFIFRIICLDLCDKFDNSSIVFKALCFIVLSDKGAKRSSQKIWQICILKKKVLWEA